MSDDQATTGDPPPGDDPGAKSAQGTNPLEQILSLVGTLDPVEFAARAIDASRRSTEALITILENFASTVDNLNRTTTRVNALLDEVEEPLRRLMPQVGGAMNAMASMGEVALQMGELAKRLSPLAAMAENAGGLFGFRPSKPSGPGEPSSTS